MAEISKTAVNKAGCFQKCGASSFQLPGTKSPESAQNISQSYTTHNKQNAEEKRKRYSVLEYYMQGTKEEKEEKQLVRTGPSGTN